MLIHGVNIRRHVAESLAALAGERSLTVKEVASKDGVTPNAIIQRRRRFEQRVGQRLPRHETRGRKPKPLTTAA